MLAPAAALDMMVMAVMAGGLQMKAEIKLVPPQLQLARAAAVVAVVKETTSPVAVVVPGTSAKVRRVHEEPDSFKILLKCYQDRSVTEPAAAAARAEVTAHRLHTEFAVAVAVHRLVPVFLAV